MQWSADGGNVFTNSILQLTVMTYDNTKDTNNKIYRNESSSHPPELYSCDKL